MRPDLINPGAATPMLTDQVVPKDLIRFGEKVKEDPISGCWLWKGFKDQKGYGKFWFRQRAWWAHRWSYAMFVGSIPEGETIDHECRNPECVRPSHLRPMTRSENVALGNKHRATPPVVEEELEEI